MNGKKALFFVLCSLFLLLSDGLIKAYVDHNIPQINASTPIYPFGGIGVFKDWHGIDFSIVHVINKGAAWGVFSSFQEYLLFARVAIIGGLLSYLLFVQTTPYRKFCLTLIASGALGNVLDHFIYGHVVDMFYLILWGYSYPVFNLADSTIFLGIALLFIEALLDKLRSSRQSKPQARAQKG